MDLQIKSLFPCFIELQNIHGDTSLDPIYGAGCIKNAKVMFIFMNPTGKNISSSKEWKGLKAPWIGTKNIWKLLFQLNMISENYYLQTQSKKASDWDYVFTKDLYKQIADNSLYITNLAKCTQIDARPLPNKIFCEYIDILYKEISIVNPKLIITFGNQVSSNILSRQVKVSDYIDTQNEALIIEGHKYLVFPTYYPVGQGMRNMPLALERIIKVLDNIV